VGEDENANALSKLMKKSKMREDCILRSKSRTTTVKTRVIGGQHQMLRIDEEMDQDLNTQDTRAFLSKIKALLKKERVSAIIFEDYDKGAINASLIQEVVELANNLQIPVAVDPKHRHFNAYKGVSLFKPNRREFEHGLKAEFGQNQQSALLEAVQQFQRKQGIDTMLVTLSEAGMLVSRKNKQNIIPAHIRSIADVSGAGDTVISVATLCLAAGLSPLHMTQIANLAGGLVCEHVGVVPVDKKQLLEEIVKISFIE
jgi:rfaE bifunctional protein kinase chain/domain